MQLVKAPVRWLLGRLVNRPRFNDSAVYRLYLNVCHPGHCRRVRAETAFYRQALKLVNADLVFDIGAHVGNKAVVFLSLVPRVVCVEPSPSAVAILTQRFLYHPGVAVVGKGAGAEEGVARFCLYGDTDYYNTFSPKWSDALARPNDPDRPRKTSGRAIDVPVTTLDRLIDEYGSPSYIKVDVEGYELNVLRGLTRVVPLLSFECNLPEFADETAECIALLSRRCPSAEFNYCLDEPPIRFASDGWLSGEEMAAVVRRGGLRFMEIYCKSQ